MTPYYDCDGITIYHGDCRQIMPALGLTVDAIVTDPPYAISVAGSAHRRPPGRGTRSLNFLPGDADWAGTTAMVREALSIARSVMVATGSIYAWIGHRQIGPLVDDFEEAGLSTRVIVWAKAHPPPPAPGAGWPSGAEFCLYAYPRGRTWMHRGRDTPRSSVIVADSYRHGQRGKVGHPTQKPEAVIRPLILASTRPGDIILDPFVGSGTTLVVARAAGRRAVGIEIEERYCEIAARRLFQGVILHTA